MYALYNSPNVLMNVSWPRGRSAEDVTRALAHTERVPLKWDVAVSSVCGAIKVVVTNARNKQVALNEGDSVAFHKCGRDGRYDAPDDADMVTVHEPVLVGKIYDVDDVDDLHLLATSARVVITSGHVMVNRVACERYALRTAEGEIVDISDYESPYDYAADAGVIVKHE